MRQGHLRVRKSAVNLGRSASFTATAGRPVPDKASTGLAIIDPMSDRDFAALDAHQLLPRVLTDIETAQLGTHLLGVDLIYPMVPHLKRVAPMPSGGLALVGAEEALEGTSKHPPELTVAQLQPDGMGTLIQRVGQLAQRGVAGVALDVSPLAAAAPFGERRFRPYTREELAELRAAAGRPLWVVGLAGGADAEVAAEAGADAVVIGSELGRHIGAPAVIDLLPEVIDAVGGMLAIVAGGPVRGGADVLRYLAVGAELVVVDGERSLDALAAELAYAMRLTGCADVADISYEVLFAPLFGES